MKRSLFGISVASFFSVILLLSLGYVQAQITGFIPRYVDEFGTEDVSACFQDTNGNIGIGTTAPSRNLHIVGGANTGLIVESSVPNGNPLIIVKANPPAGQAAIYLDRADVGAPAQLRLATGGVQNWTVGTPVSFFDRLDINNGAGTNTMSVLQNGNVGIGTSNPQAKLEVVGGDLRVSQAHLRVSPPGSSYQDAIKITNPNPNGGTCSLYVRQGCGTGGVSLGFSGGVNLCMECSIP